VKTPIFEWIWCEESWTALFIVGPLPCIYCPIGVGEKNYIFFIKEDNGLVSFDLCTQMVGELGIKGQHNCCHIGIYQKNLLSIGEIN